MYQTNLNGDVKQLTDDWMDFGSIQMLGNTGKILASRHSISQADELYIITPGKDVKKTKVQQVTWENKAFYDQLEMGKVQKRWVKTTDDKQMLVWVILPPHFDENKKYPTLLFCEGGPQSPVSQFWSYRWNFQIMAANDYIVIAPNRRGLPGFGSEWNEAVSGDWTGQCMDDYLSAILSCRSSQQALQGIHRSRRSFQSRVDVYRYRGGLVLKLGVRRCLLEVCQD